MTTETPPDPFEIDCGRRESGGAVYWPDTFFVDLTSYDRSHTNVPAFAIRMVAKADPGQWTAGAASLHESMHWLQQMGTTYGLLLTLNRAAIGDLAQAVLATAKPSEIDVLDDARRRGVAPAARDRDGRLRHEHGYPGTIQSLFDHWWAGHAFEHLVASRGQKLLGRIDPSYVVGLSMRYVGAGGRVGQVFNAPDQDFQRITRQWAPRGELPPSRHRLTGRHIEEAAALTAQHLFNAGAVGSFDTREARRYASESRRWIEDRLSDPNQALYWKALRVYFDRAPSIDGFRHAELFLLICDLALNPRVVVGEPLDQRWDDFMPELRFERLLDALETFKVDEAVVHDRPPESWWLSERERLAAAAGLSDGSTMAPPLAEKPSAVAKRHPAAHIRSFALKAAGNLNRLRSVVPAALPSPVHAVDHDQRLRRFERGCRGPSFSVPLSFDADLDGRTKLSNRDYDDLLCAVTARRALQCWLTSPDPITWRGLPANKLAVDCRSDVVALLPSSAAAQEARGRSPGAPRARRRGGLLRKLSAALKSSGIVRGEAP